MATNTTHRQIRKWLAAGALAVALAACGGDQDAPEALPLASDEPTGSEIAVDTAADEPTDDDVLDGQVIEDELDEEQSISAPASTVAPTTTVPATTTTTTTTTSTTTTTAPVAAPTPIEPTVTVECATTPPHVSIGFGDPEIDLDWTIVGSQHPGGTGLPSVVTEWAAGPVTPVLPLDFDIDPNTILITATTTNADGDSAETQVSVSRFDSCPVANSLAGRTVDQIDCTTGAFVFRERSRDILVDGEPYDDSLVINSVVIDRWNGVDEELPVNPGGVYWVPNWNGHEELKAIVTFTDIAGTHEEHINSLGCGVSPFGVEIGSSYNVCSDERLYIAYPDDLVSNVDLDGAEANSCSFFRVGPVDGHRDHNVTITSLGRMTLDEAQAALLSNQAFVITDEQVIDRNAFSNPASGLRRDFERRGFELSIHGETELSAVSKVWLIDLDGEILEVRSDFAGLDIIDGMVNSMQFVVQ